MSQSYEGDIVFMLTKEDVLACAMELGMSKNQITDDVKEDRQVIKSIIKTPNGMVLVFDGKGEQIPEYQGQYEKVKSRILNNAPPSAEFSYAFDNETEIKAVPREEW